MPSRFGIVISITTISGFNWAAAMNAADPSRTAPTISKSWLRRFDKLSRISAWSSARSTVGLDFVIGASSISWAQTESEREYDSIQGLSLAFVYSEEKQLSKETAAREWPA